MEPIRSADVVIVGGGPIGLATAIQVKKLTGKEVVVIEKYDTYKRTSITLRIKEASLKGLGDIIPEFKPHIRNWTAHPVPIADIEGTLLAKAHEMGVQILRPKTGDYSNLQKEFPNAKFYIGADGAKSEIRKKAFNDSLLFEKTHQHLVNIRYRVRLKPGETKPGKIKEYLRLKLSQYYINESRKKGTDAHGDYADVSLQVFVDEAEYNEMSKATFGSPYYFDTDLDKIPKKLQNALKAYWGSQNVEIIQNPEKKNQISVIKLGSYAAKTLWKKEENNAYTVIVGDAAEAFPFFQAINNGFKCSTKLSKSIAKGFKTNSYEKPLKSYQTYSHLRGVMHLITSTVTSFFVTLAKFWLSQPHDTISYRIKTSHEFEMKQRKRGEEIWNRLSTAPAAT